MKNISDDLKKLYVNTCNIYEFTCLKNDNNRISQRKILVYENLPCKISYFNASSINNMKENLFNTSLKQYIKLFLEKEILIKPGSSAKVFNNNIIIGEFKNSSKPYLYTNHQEVLFELDKNIT